MTQDEIIEMASKSGLIATPWVIAFAKLVAAKEQKKWEDQTAVEIHEAVLEEREACALVCDKASAVSLPAFLAMQIRARGEA